jgi:rubrerythrin
MLQFDSVDNILDYAIENEEYAVEVYTILAEKVDDGLMREILKTFAREEERHKAKLLKIKESRHMEAATGRVKDLKIADNLIPRELSEYHSVQGFDYESALIMAMKAEKAAFKLYTDLAAAVTAPKLQGIFLALAEEEAKHKFSSSQHGSFQSISVSRW